MDERNDDVDKIDEVMLPGFRFHPTDEELVGFYLKRKIQQRPLSIELIRQLDIYKYDPWDLPKLAASGEKEWYFYCPRDRKYRNSARPNRVTGAGFWKATGTDRPIYSSECGSKCIGLKKSLVFYKGRAAKGTKTDWMMHEFRLPSTTTDSESSKRYIDRSIPANDAWAICRIFKKTNSAAQRALSHSWMSSTTENTTSEMLTQHVQTTSHLTSHNMQLPNNKTNSTLQFYSTMNNQEKPTISTPYNPLHQMPFFNRNYTLSPNDPQTFEVPSKQYTTNDASSLLLNMSSSIFGDSGNKESPNEDYNIGGILQDQQWGMQGHHVGGYGEEFGGLVVKEPNVVNLEDEQWGTTIRPVGFPYNLPLNLPLYWDSSPCLTETSSSSNYSTNKVLFLS